MPVCIYCLRSDVSFTKGEHVIQQGLGKFGGGTQVLRDKVCDKCNAEFGRTIDRVLATDTPEGLERMRILKKDKLGNTLGQSRLNLYLTLNVLNEPPLELKVDMAHYRKTRVLLPLPQIVVKDPITNNRVIFTKSEIENGVEGLDKFIMRDMYILGPDREAIEAVIAALKAAGVPYKENQQLLWPGPPDELKVEARIDKDALRAVAKMAFNFVAANVSIVDLTQPEFNTARDFIRLGKGQLDIKTQGEFFYGEEENIHVETNAIAIGCSCENGVIKVMVRIFDKTTYTVPIGASKVAFPDFGYIFTPGEEPSQLGSYANYNSGIYIVRLGIDQNKGFVWKTRRLGH